MAGPLVPQLVALLLACSWSGAPLRRAAAAAPGATPWYFPASWRTGQRVAPVDRLLGICGKRQLTDQDPATFWLVSRWAGFENRTDLGLLRSQGTRALALFRCVVEPDLLRAFLDRAYTEGLTVVPELPKRLFVQEPDGCLHTGFDCFRAVRSHWRKLLATPLVEELGQRRYHPAVEAVLLSRELDEDAATVTAATCAGGCGLPDALQAVLTAWDGLLDAELELGVAPGRVRVAATLSSAAVSGAEGTPGAASAEEQLCYRRRASEGGCTGRHTLRSFWTSSRRLRNATYQPFAPHQNLTALLDSRWLHTFAAHASTDEVLRALRDYEEFVEPAPENNTPAALLEFRT